MTGIYLMEKAAEGEEEHILSIADMEGPLIATSSASASIDRHHRCVQTKRTEAGNRKCPVSQLADHVRPKLCSAISFRFGQVPRYAEEGRGLAYADDVAMEVTVGRRRCKSD